METEIETSNAQLAVLVTSRPWVQSFLGGLAQHLSVSDAADVAGISRQTVYGLRHANPAFATAWRDAQDRAIDRLQRSAFQRCVEGDLRPVFWKGEECGKIRVFPDELVKFFLRSFRPEIFGQKSSVEISGPGGGSIPVSIEDGIKRIYGTALTGPVIEAEPAAPLPLPEPGAAAAAAAETEAEAAAVAAEAETEIKEQKI